MSFMVKLYLPCPFWTPTHLILDIPCAEQLFRCRALAMREMFRATVRYGRRYTKSFWTPITLILDMCIYSFQRTSRCFKTAARTGLALQQNILDPLSPSRSCGRQSPRTLFILSVLYVLSSLPRQPKTTDNNGLYGQHGLLRQAASFSLPQSRDPQAGQKLTPASRMLALLFLFSPTSEL